MLYEVVMDRGVTINGRNYPHGSIVDAAAAKGVEFDTAVKDGALVESTKKAEAKAAPEKEG